MFTTIVLPLCIISINLALYTTQRQQDIIDATSLKKPDVSYLVAQFTEHTRRRAIFNMVGGFLCILLYSTVHQASYLVVCGITMFAHTLGYLSIVWFENERFIERLRTDKTKRQKSTPVPSPWVQTQQRETVQQVPVPPANTPLGTSPSTLTEALFRRTVTHTEPTEPIEMNFVRAVRSSECLRDISSFNEY